MALSITDLKKGTIFEENGTPYKVVEYSQKVLGRGGSIVNVKIKSLADGKVLDKTYKGNDQFDEARITNLDANYLYSDGHKLFFMDDKTFEQYEVEVDVVGEQKKFLKEGSKSKLQLFNSAVIGVEMPKNVYLEVVYAEDVVRGDTSSSVQKDAKLETGASVRVPAFIKTGDVISVDVETGKYRERKK